MAKSIIWYDTETTGLKDEHEIIQFAGIIQKSPTELIEFNYKLKPKRPEIADPEALRINGITMEQALEFPSQEDVLSEFVQILEVNKPNEDRYILAGYNNINFDNPRLRKLFEDNELYVFDKYFNEKDTIDVFHLSQVARQKGAIQTTNGKLATVAQFFDYIFDAHEAMADIVATRVVASKIQKLPMYQEIKRFIQFLRWLRYENGIDFFVKNKNLRNDLYRYAGLNQDQNQDPNLRFVFSQYGYGTVDLYKIVGLMWEYIISNKYDTSKIKTQCKNIYELYSELRTFIESPVQLEDKLSNI